MLQNYYQKFNDALFKVNVILFVNQSQKLSKAPIDILSRDEMEALPPSEVGPSVLYQKVLKKSYCLPISLLTVEQLRLLGTQAYLSHPLVDKAGQAYYFNRNEHITVEIPITSNFVIEVDPTFFDAATDYTKPDVFAKNLKDVYRPKPTGSKRLSFFQGLSLKIVDKKYATHEEEQKAADLALSIDPFNWKGYFLKAYATQSLTRPVDATEKMNWYMDIINNYRMASLSQPLALKPRENAIILGMDLMRDSKIAALDSQKINQFTDQWLAIGTEKPFFVALRKEIEKSQNNLNSSELKDLLKKSEMVNLEKLFDMYNSVIKRSFDYYRGSPEKIQLLKNRVNVIVNELVAIYKDFPQFSPDAKSFLEKLKKFRESYGG
jgi:hypothetical protein